MKGSNLLKRYGLLFGLCLFLMACNSQSDFNYGKVQNIIEGAPIHLDAEYVMLTSQQVECGTESDLWEAPVESGGHRIAHLTQKARDLKFSDDVSIGDMSKPYVQVRGDFSLAVNEVTSDKDGPEPNTRLVIAKVGIPIQDSCFGGPLPLMGVHKGDFRQDYSPVLLFRYSEAWHLERFVH